ncbi:MAG: hypothetical protein NZ455_11645, partial [Bacteroidia bacterium]|nr:hypothetical protein [Bacteroidia bacterium]
ASEEVRKSMEIEDEIIESFKMVERDKEKLAEELKQEKQRAEQKEKELQQEKQRAEQEKVSMIREMLKQGMSKEIVMQIAKVDEAFLRKYNLMS